MNLRNSFQPLWGLWCVPRLVDRVGDVFIGPSAERRPAGARRARQRPGPAVPGAPPPALRRSLHAVPRLHPAGPARWALPACIPSAPVPLCSAGVGACALRLGSGPPCRPCPALCGRPFPVRPARCAPPASRRPGTLGPARLYPVGPSAPVFCRRRRLRPASRLRAPLPSASHAVRPPVSRPPCTLCPACIPPARHAGPCPPVSRRPQCPCVLPASAPAPCVSAPGPLAVRVPCCAATRFPSALRPAGPALRQRQHSVRCPPALRRPLRAVPALLRFVGPCALCAALLRFVGLSSRAPCRAVLAPGLRAVPAPVPRVLSAPAPARPRPRPGAGLGISASCRGLGPVVRAVRRPVIGIRLGSPPRVPALRLRSASGSVCGLGASVVRALCRRLRLAGSRRSAGAWSLETAVWSPGPCSCVVACVLPGRLLHGVASCAGRGCRLSVGFREGGWAVSAAAGGRGVAVCFPSGCGSG